MSNTATTSATVTTANTIRTNLKFTNGQGGAKVSKFSSNFADTLDEYYDHETDADIRTLTVVAYGFQMKENLFYNVTMKLAVNGRSWVVTHNHGLVCDPLSLEINGEKATIKAVGKTWNFDGLTDDPKKFFNHVEDELIALKKENKFQNVEYEEILDKYFLKVFDLKDATNKRIKQDNKAAKAAYKAAKKGS